MLTLGNHHSVEKDPDTLLRLLEEDVEEDFIQGHSLPLPLHCIHEFRLASLAPLEGYTDRRQLMNLVVPFTIRTE